MKIVDRWFTRHQRRSFPISTLGCRMASELPETANRRWYVFDGECGEQIVMTIPVELIPSHITAAQMLEAAVLANRWCAARDPGHIEVRIVEDFGHHIPRSVLDPDQRYEVELAWLQQTGDWFAQMHEQLPWKVSPAEVFEVSFAMDRGLPGWEVAGQVSGASLLTSDLWLHNFLLARGREDVNKLRRMLGLPELAEFDPQFCQADRVYLAQMQTIGLI